MQADQFSIKKMFLQALIVSVGISAFLGIVAILSGDFGEMQVKVLCTSLIISGASLGGLCCGAAYEAGRFPFFSLAGMLPIAVCSLMLLVGLWGELNDDAFWKTALTILSFAVAFAHLSLLNLARLAQVYQAALWAAYVIIFGFCMISSTMIWGELHDEIAFRILGVDAILIAAVSLLIPILHRLSRGELVVSGGDIEAALADIDYEMGGLKRRLHDLEQQKERLLER